MTLKHRHMIAVAKDLHLAPIAIADHEKLSGLMFRIYPPVYQHLWKDGGAWYVGHLYAKNNLEKELGDPNSRYYFIHYRGTTVGVLRVLVHAPLPGTENANATQLQRIYLDPAVQGKGIGKTLLQWCVDRFCRDGKATLWLEVMDTQKAAIRFYEKAGFHIAGALTFRSDLMFENYRGMYVMCKPAPV